MGEEELAVQLDLILVVGCAELPPSGRGRCLNFVFSNGAYWNNKELMYNARLTLSVLQILSFLKYGHFKNGNREGSHILIFSLGKLRKRNKIQMT